MGFKYLSNKSVKHVVKYLNGVCCAVKEAQLKNKMKQRDLNVFSVKKESLFMRAIVWISAQRDFMKTLQIINILARNVLKVVIRVKTTQRLQINPKFVFLAFKSIFFISANALRNAQLKHMQTQN